MGQKVHPTGFRVGVTEDWSSRWYATKQEFPKKLLEDQKVRRYVKGRYGRAGIPKIELERKGEELNVILYAARPGLIIGKRGAIVDELRLAIEELTRRTGNVSVSIREVKDPDLDAQLVAESIAEQLIKRQSFRRAMKRTLDTCMQAGARGVKVRVSGRLGGAEMARTENAISGSIPLTTLQADISYGTTTARTTYGAIGVKVWIYRGDRREREDVNDGADAQARQVSKAAAR
ncbi:MAG: 30S ribosomal protein S3 [Planctomycetota bacterium]